jgi:hypothetical protein
MIDNGIIIDGVIHEVVKDERLGTESVDACDFCSIKEECSNGVCSFYGDDIHFEEVEECE